MSEPRQQFVNAILVTCAVAMTIVVVRRELIGAPVATARLTEVSDWSSVLKAGDVLGPLSAQVRLVVFADFQCPACRQFATVTWPAVRRKFPDTVSLTFRHYPLAYHREAYRAARAAVCASREHRFQAMHDALFQLQDSLGIVPWTSVAAGAGVTDTVRFARCVNDTMPVPQIEADLIEVSRLNSNGTPTVLINGQRFMTPPDTTALFAAIEKLL